jgi:hypothetical protein
VEARFAAAFAFEFDAPEQVAAPSLPAEAGVSVEARQTIA